MDEGNQEEARFAAEWLAAVVAANVKAHRKQKGWSYSNLVKRSGISKAAIERAEHPEYGGVTLSTLGRLAWVLEVPVSDLVTPAAHACR